MRTDAPILLFDGVCNLCNGTVQFLIKRDREGKFKFASLQSDVAKELLKAYGLSPDAFDSFVYLKNGRSYQRSTAALHVLKDLGGLWKLFYGFIILPAPFRDLVYNLIARNRYRVFGRRDSCMIPTPELKSRFLDNGES